MYRYPPAVPLRLPASPVPSKRSSTMQEPIANKRLSNHSSNVSLTAPSHSTWQPPEAGITVPDDIYSELKRLKHVPKEDLALYMGVMFRLETDAHPSWQYDSPYSQRSSMSSSCWTRASMTSNPSSTTSDGLFLDITSLRNSGMLSQISEPTQGISDPQSVYQVHPETGSQKLPPGPRIYFCTYSCSQKSFVKRSDWKSHETQCHDPQVEFICTLCNIPVSFHLEKRFTQHHGNNHGCKPCSHAAECKRALPTKRAWGCGFCGQCLPTWDARAKHVATHFENGMDLSSWEHRQVIRGLLRQPTVAKEWLEILNRMFGTPDCWPQLDWLEDDTSDLQNGLQLGNDISAETLASEAFRLAIPIEPRTESTIEFPRESKILRSQAEDPINRLDYIGTAQGNEAGVEGDSHLQESLEVRTFNHCLVNEAQLQATHSVQSPPSKDVSNFTETLDIIDGAKESGAFNGSYEDFVNLYMDCDSNTLNHDIGLATRDMDLLPDAWTADLPIQSHTEGNGLFHSSIASDRQDMSHHPSTDHTFETSPPRSILTNYTNATQPTSPLPEAPFLTRPKTPLGRFVKRLKTHT